MTNLQRATAGQTKYHPTVNFLERFPMLVRVDGQSMNCRLFFGQWQVFAIFRTDFSDPA
jgi:hypothetical protein